MITQTKLLKPNGIELSQESTVFSEDFEQSLRLFREERVVAIFGGSALNEGTEYYEAARSLAYKLAQAKCSIITGGGPGIMRAGNRGASEAHGKTYGLRVEAIHDENTVDTPHIQEGNLLIYRTLSVRLLTLVGASDAIVFFPGGFGTLEEMFSLLVRVRVGMMKQIPIYFYGSKFWNGLKNWMSDEVLGNHTISKKDLELVQIEDDLNVISAKIIEQLPPLTSVKE